MKINAANATLPILPQEEYASSATSTVVPSVQLITHAPPAHQEILLIMAKPVLAATSSNAHNAAPITSAPTVLII